MEGEGEKIKWSSSVAENDFKIWWDTAISKFIS